MVDGLQLVETGAATVQNSKSITIKVDVEKFNTKLNDDPKENETGYNKFTKTKYVPISYIQMTMDELFFGAWSTENFTTQVIANEIVGSIGLKYYHPELKTWITRVGAASVMIRQNRGANITDIGQKIKNTLVMDYPHLLSACIANAARSIGKIFGRDLNRDYQDSFNPVVTNDIKSNLKLIKKRIRDNIHGSKNIENAKKFQEKCKENTDNIDQVFWDKMLTESEKL